MTQLNKRNNKFSLLSFYYDDIEHGAHDYFEATHYFRSGLYLIWEMARKYTENKE